MPTEWGAAGHTLHYFLGDAPTPGIVAMKGVSRRMIGLTAEPSGEDGWLPLPVLAVADATADA